MEQIQKAIENITYYSDKFPKKEFEVISANKDVAIPYLRSAVEKAIKEGADIDKEYQLHFYAIYLLAQFQDREFFSKLMELVCLPADTLELLLGDALTESVKDILYNTYNGDLQLIKQTIYDKQVDDYAKSAMLDVMGQLCLDQTLSKQEFQDFLRDLVYREERIGDYIYTRVAYMICRCHFMEMLPEVRKLYEDGQVEEFSIGSFDDCVDKMFQYKDGSEQFCRSPLNAAKMLQGWAMFEDSSEEKSSEQENKHSEKELSKLSHNDANKVHKTEQKKTVQVGRNDPCPCGSGKKYKKCCMNKLQNTVEMIESQQEREKWLRHYPPAKTEEIEGRIYLEDFYSQESIEIDKLLYLAMRHRGGFLWQRESADVANKRSRVYLTEAYKRFKEIVIRENIQNFSAYDSKYSIHYLCEEWISRLCELLEDKDEDDILCEVQETYEKMKSE
ncbi:MAG: DUF1186 domain-containing protein [Lachnospiraceae bacterium]|nr:DUF1186 domain-containing protein [Lachnospiraceae bacterium]